jgi:uncharacterized repeat protein (TIGR01451 family)
VFVTKLSSSGNSLVYSTYLGGSDSDIGGGSIAVDGAGSAYVAGATFSTDFPTQGSYKAGFAGVVDAFVTKLEGPKADVSITKTDGVAAAAPGWPLTYTIVAMNAGPWDAPSVTVADTFPATCTGATWTCAGADGGTCAVGGSGEINDSANLPSGGSATYTATCTVSASATGSLSNTATATVSGSLTDPTPGNNSATDTDTLTPGADLSTTKTDGQATAVTGAPITYTIVASNAGPTGANGATLADTVPTAITGATWACVGGGGGSCTASGSGSINDTVNLPVGGTVTYTLTGTISGSATGSLNNTASVAAPAGVTDPNLTNNSATDTDTLIPGADLSITKTDAHATALQGQPITYTIVASNAGPNTANGATVADAPPAVITGVTWTCGGAGGASCTASGSGDINDSVNLPVGGTVTYTMTGTISESATGDLSNTATVTTPGDVADPDDTNNTATDTDTLGRDFYTLVPCRVIDTRDLGAPIGGPVLRGQETRIFAVVGNCDIPSTAKALLINLTVTQPTAQGHVVLFRADEAMPNTPVVYYEAGLTRANNATVSLSASGELAAFLGQRAGTTVHLIIDVNGYFE